LRSSPGAVAALAFTAAGKNPAHGQSGTKNSYVPKYFTADEWRFLVRRSNALFRRTDRAGAVETGVPEFIDRQMELPYGHGAYFYLQGPFQPDAPATLGYQLRYTPRALSIWYSCSGRTLQWTAADKLFADLTPDRARSISLIAGENQVQLSGPPAAAFFGQLLENAREGYFADPLYGGNRGMAAWKWIGFPGARADFTDWIDQAGHKYPYGPVAISGTRG
jgi:gluconate 2-dehydrogenase gamma chain